MALRPDIRATAARAKSNGGIQKTAVLPPGRKGKRYLLPSCRVAEFMLPNVGEYLTLQETALSTSDGNPENAVKFGLAIMLSQRRTGLRLLLKGISHVPVASILKPGIDVDAAIKEAEAGIRTKFPDDDEDTLANKISTAVETAQYAAEDVEAMVASANIQAVSDWQWDQEGYLKSIQASEMGTVEAADWLALNEIMANVVQDLARLSQGAPSADPKAQRVTRRWRSSGS